MFETCSRMARDLFGCLDSLVGVYVLQPWQRFGLLLLVGVFRLGVDIQWPRSADIHLAL